MSSVMEIAMKEMGQLIELAQANLKVLPGPIVNVSGYGAVGDGVTNDTVVVQTAVDYAISNGMKAVFFPRGTSGQYFVTALTNANQVVLFGDNASFVGGYTGTILQIGASGVSQSVFDALKADFTQLNNELFSAQDIETSFNILDYRAPTDVQQNSFTITKDNYASTGGTQKAALLVRNGIASSVANEEVGIFSILDVLGNAQHHVGIYSQVNASGAASSFLYGGCIEIKNTQLDGSGTTTNQALVGLEIDMVNKYEFDGTDLPTTRKTGISLVAWGGGTSHEAIGVYSSGARNGDGAYQSGDWLYGLIMRTGSIDTTQGNGILIQSDHSIGLKITGKSNIYGIDLEGNALAAGSVGININANYSIAMAIPADKFIKINGAGGSEGLFYDSVAGALTLSAGKLSLLNHTAATTATAGASGAAPAQVAGYIKCFVGGSERRIPFYNV